MTRVIGLDLSLTSTGVADLRVANYGDTVNSLTLHRFQTEAAGGHFRTQHQRMKTIGDGVAGVVVGRGELVRPVSPRLVVVEAPAYGSKTAFQHDVSGNWWRVVGMLLDRGLDVLTVTPHQLKIYACGSAATSGPNKVGKGDVADAVQSRYGRSVAQQIDGNGTDVVDAFVLAALGARVVGSAIETAPLPKSHARALDNLDLTGIATGMPDAAW